MAQFKHTTVWITLKETLILATIVGVFLLTARNGDLSAIIFITVLTLFAPRCVAINVFNS
jgi:hypothetical protein